MSQSITDRAQQAAQRCVQYADRFPDRRAACPDVTSLQRDLRGIHAERAERTALQSFWTYPQAHYGWLYFVATALILGWLIAFFSPAATMLCLAIVILATSLQFGMHLPALDALFDKHLAHNLIVDGHAPQNADRELVLVCHADAQEQRHWLAIGGKKWAYFVNIASWCGFIYLFVVTLIGVIQIGYAVHAPQGNLLYAYIGATAFVPIWAMLYFYTDPKAESPNSDAALRACVAASAIAEYLQENPLKHTRVRLVVHDASESGLRGARAYLRGNPQLHHRNAMPALYVNFDTIYGDCPILRKRERGATMPTSAMARDIALHAAQTAQIPLQIDPIGIGSTDASVYSAHRLGMISLTEQAHKTNVPMSDKQLQHSLETWMLLGIAIAHTLDEADLHPMR